MRSCSSSILTLVLQAAWIHFANHLSPEGRDVPGWAEYGAGKNSLKIEGRLTKPINDTFREEQISFFMVSRGGLLLAYLADCQSACRTTLLGSTCRMRRLYASSSFLHFPDRQSPRLPSRCSQTSTKLPSPVI